MELDDLKTAWRDLDRRLDRSLELGQRALREIKLDQTRGALRPLAWSQYRELMADVLALLLVVAFLGAHGGTARFAVSGAVLLLAALSSIAANARQLVAIGSVDYGAPVVGIQRQLAALRRQRIRTTLALLVSAPLLWTPLLIVAAQGLLGFDVIAAFGAPWIAANLAFGVLVIVAAIWLARRYGERLRGVRIIGSLADALAGRSLAQATTFLTEIERFEAGA